MVQREGGGGRKKNNAMMSTEDTITNLGTLVIIDDPEDLDDDMDTMKSMLNA